MFSQLEDLFGDWDKTEIFQVDERVAPAGDDERNLTHLIESLSIGAQGSIQPMPVTDEDLEAAADRYAESLPEAPRPRPSRDRAGRAHRLARPRRPGARGDGQAASP